MEILALGVFLLFLLTVSAKPEIPSKGKHTAILDARQQGTSNEEADMPRFAEPISNVTVSVGRDALLACVVENLKGYKVAWVRVDTQTILSIHHNLISQNSRISLSYNDHRSWYLHIREVEESDRGWYMCQINTDPMRSRKGYLQVVVPPMIIEGMTSNDLVVREGLNVTLVCKARGYPEPYVMWRREDGEEMLIGGEHVNVVDGEYLHITKVSRLHMAAYLCVASNGVPPSISKRVHLRVQFPPMLSIPNQLEGAYIGQDVMLECHTEAYPASINYWTTERGDMIISDTSRAGDKYETTSTVSGYTKFMKLKIRSVGPNDFGTYRCVAKNSLGETDGNIKLDEMPAPTPSITSDIHLWNRTIDGKRRNRNKFDLNALPDYGVEEWRDGAGNGGLNNGNNIHVNGNDNNQTPVRNPPGAFHNSAGGGLAQHNLLGRIIHGIKMQSFGIFQQLWKYFAGKRIESANDAGTVQRESQRDTPAEQKNRLFTNQMIVFLSSTNATTMLNNDNDQTPVEIVNSNKSANVNICTCHKSTNHFHVDRNQMNNKIVSDKGSQINTNKTEARQQQKGEREQEKQKQKREQHSKLLQLRNNMNVNMRRIIMNIQYWLEAPSTRVKDVGDKYSTVTTRAIIKLASLLPTSLAMVAKLICIIIFSISIILLLLLHLIIDVSSSIRCKNNISAAHNNTTETHHTAATSTSASASTESISGNRLLPLRTVLQQSPPRAAQLPIPSSEPSASTNVSHTEVTLSHRRRQQQKQQRKQPRRQKINKFNNNSNNRTTTNAPITVSTHPPALAKISGIVLHIFHKLLEMR